jgi:hypothetical protein
MLASKKKHVTDFDADAGVAQLVEHELPMLVVASSNLVTRSLFSVYFCAPVYGCE